jgi:hypothetical protein
MGVSRIATYYGAHETIRETTGQNDSSDEEGSRFKA